MRSAAQDTFTDGRGRFSGNGRGVETSESQCFSFFLLSFRVVASLLTHFFLLNGSLRHREREKRIKRRSLLMGGKRRRETGEKKQSVRRMTC